MVVPVEANFEWTNTHRNYLSGVFWCEGFNEVQLGQSAGALLPGIDQPDFGPLRDPGYYLRLGQKRVIKLGAPSVRIALAQAASATALTCGSLPCFKFHFVSSPQIDL